MNESMVDSVIRDRERRRGCSYQSGTEERERVKIRRDLHAALVIYCPRCNAPIFMDREEEIHYNTYRGLNYKDRAKVHQFTKRLLS